MTTTRVQRVVMGICVLNFVAACSSEVELADDVGADLEALSGEDPAPLSTVPVPQPTGGDIVDQAAAIRLGKAFFWDIQVSGDGQVACASCHFRAGADNRRLNTLNPGPDGIFASGGVTGPGQTFNLVSIANDDRVGSQGVARANFNGIAADPASAADSCTPVVDEVFGTQRRVTGRNTPSAIGAVFFRDNFWDGRANHVFNGRDPFGNTGNAAEVFASIQNASLASQAAGPPENDVEMMCTGRRFNGAGSLGTKLLARTALQFQRVDPTDSVLGSLSNSPNNGLRCGSSPCTYPQLIQAAFGTSLSNLTELQFSRFWGQAVQAYEATLIPDQTPLDRFLAGQQTALTSQQQRGLDRFKGKGNCTKCHAGAELSDATVRFAANNGLINEDGGDQGFHNIGVRPTAEDLGRAGLGPRNVTFSVSRSNFDRGAFKTPALRNVKLTAPYFHNGGKATLAEVVDFYNRGGDFRNPELAKRIQPLSLDSGDQAALVDFLTNGLTDCRVDKERAPFDHPSLVIPNGPSLPAVGAAGTGTCP
jgi:cytochrome c peroxidase